MAPPTTTTTRPARKRTPVAASNKVSAPSMINKKRATRATTARAATVDEKTSPSSPSKTATATATATATSISELPHKSSGLPSSFEQFPRKTLVKLTGKPRERLQQIAFMAQFLANFVQIEHNDRFRDDFYDDLLEPTRRVQDALQALLRDGKMVPTWMLDWSDEDEARATSTTTSPSNSVGMTDDGKVPR